MSITLGLVANHQTELDHIMCSLGVPVALLTGTASSVSASDATLKAFEVMLARQQAGMEFCLNVMLDHLLQEGQKALEEYVSRCPPLSWRN